MKKMIAILLIACMLLSMAACGAKQTETNNEAAATEAAEWSREGYFADENGNMVSITYMDDIDEPGWYAGFMNGEDPIEDSYGGTLQQEGDTLHGVVATSGETNKELTVTVSEEGEDGLQLVVEGGDTYHFKKFEMAEPAATLTVNTYGLGTFTCVEEGSEEAADESLSSLQYGLEEATTYVLTAIAGDGWYFDKWMMNGEDYSVEEQITVEVAQDTDLVAVFWYDEGDDSQNPESLKNDHGGSGFDLGSSEIFTEDELYAAVGKVQIVFAGFEGCEMHSIRYAGDENVNDENLTWLNGVSPAGGYTQVAEFLMDFHSPVEGGGAWEADTEYRDYQWWLGRADGGDWEVVTWGY